MPVFAVSLKMRVGQLPPSDGEQMASCRAGTVPIRRARALTGAALSVPRRRPPFAILTPCNWLKTAARLGQTTAQQRATRLAKNHNASETNLTHVSVRKSCRAGRKDGLAGDFRDLAVVWQASGAAMGVSRLIVKPSELSDIAAFPGCQARAGGRKWQKYEGQPSEISLSGPRTRIRDRLGVRRAAAAQVAEMARRKSLKSL